MSNKFPLVSIITPVYNSQAFLPRLFYSVKNQDYFNYEHILIDDCSTDNSLQLISNLASKDNSVKCIVNNTNRGPVVSRNLGIQKARGKYIAFLDADDYWLPNKLSIQTKFMEETNCVISFTDYRFISSDGSKIGNCLRGPSKVDWSLHHMTRYLGCLTIMINYDICSDFSFPDVSSEIRAEDFIAWSNIIKNYGPAIRCNGDLARYAVIDNSRSSNAIKNSVSVWYVYRKIEKINLIVSIFYFIFYLLSTFIKRIYYKPFLPSIAIDKFTASNYFIKND
jgi:teichuronic acid biosynthesis glycosyltransferase TuaG